MTIDGNSKKANKMDAGNGSNGICRVINASRSPSPDPGRSYGQHQHAMSQSRNSKRAFGLVAFSGAMLCGVATVMMGPGGLKEGASPPILLAGIVLLVVACFCRFWAD